MNVPSKYNICSKIKNSENYFIVNMLSGHADLLDPLEYASLTDAMSGKNIDPVLYDEFVQKGYFIKDDEEGKLYRLRYLDFLDKRDKEELQLFFVTNYSCNFACSYCYQDQYKPDSVKLKQEVIDYFFRYILNEFHDRNKYLTIFGGEPLLDSASQKKNIAYFISKANEANLEIAIVTNGYNLTGYIDMLKKARIREIQVTLDGTEEIHDKRRFLKNGRSTFKQIVEGIDECLKHNININLRFIADRENMNHLPELASFAIRKGWTKSNFFKTQIGRNYELHHCQSAPDKLFSRISLYEKLFELIEAYPHIEEFYKPAYSISKFLWENKELPEPLFDSCPACKTEWAFDYTGKIYSCTATVGKSDEVLGSFYPEITKASNIIQQWEARDVAGIEDCKNCSLQLACGGGCGSVAKNNSGEILSKDCRPVKELMELGFSRYFDKKNNYLNLHGVQLCNCK